MYSQEEILKLQKELYEAAAPLVEFNITTSLLGWLYQIKIGGK